MKSNPFKGVAVTEAPAIAVNTSPQGRKPFRKPKAKKYFNAV